MLPMLRRALGAAIWAPLSACAPASAQRSPTESGRAPLEIYSTIDGGLLTPVRLVARDSSTWSALWRAVLHSADSGRTPLPQIDFTRHAVAVISLGRVPSLGGLWLLPDAVQVRGDTAVIGVVEYRLPDSCPVASAPSAPATVIRFAAEARHVRYGVVRRTSRDCRAAEVPHPREQVVADSS